MLKHMHSFLQGNLHLVLPNDVIPRETVVSPFSPSDIKKNKRANEDKAKQALIQVSILICVRHVKIHNDAC